VFESKFENNLFEILSIFSILDRLFDFDKICYKVVKIISIIIREYKESQENFLIKKKQI